MCCSCIIFELHQCKTKSQSHSWGRAKAARPVCKLKVGACPRPPGTAAYGCASCFNLWCHLRIFSARQHIALCLARYMLSPVRQSVRLSVTRVDHTKTVEVRIMKFSPYGSPIPLFFAKFNPEILRGSPRTGKSNKGWVEKSHFLAQYLENGRRYTSKVTIND